MSRFAPVVPIQIAEKLQGESKDVDFFGSYHLVLAHDILARPEDYKRVYGEVRQRYRDGSFIILDNSIVELGQAMGMEDLYKAAEIINPDCIVIPDAMGDGQKTREMAVQFDEDYYEYANKHNQQRTKWPLLGVLQGSTVEDCMKTHSTFLKMARVQYISVPRVIVKQQGTRMPVLEALGDCGAYRGIHLLGFSDNLLDDVACARMSIVKGIDSAVPIRAGLQGQMLQLATHFDCGPRGDFWERKVESIEQYMDTITNLSLIRQWITREPSRLDGVKAVNVEAENV